MTRPTAAPRLRKGARRRGKKGGRNDLGIAVVMVLICLAILLPFTATFNYNARVDYQSAINHADEIKARNVNRGAMQLSELLFMLQRDVFNQKQFIEFVGRMDITQVAPYLMSIFGTSDGAEALGSFVGMDTSALSDLSLGEGAGSFEYRLEAESGKININCLAMTEGEGNAPPPQSRVVQTFEAIMQPSIYDSIFEEEKLDGNRYTRQEVLTAMVDYIDADIKRYDLARLKSGGTGENYRYTELYDAYEPRNARLDSIEELHLVEGVDDDIMAAFSHFLTTYGDCKVNLNFASPEQIAFVLKHAVAGKDRWKTEGDNFLTMTMPLANFVAETREFNTLFKKLDEVKELVAKPDEFVNPLTLLGDDPASQDTNMPRVPEGLGVRVNGGSDDQGNKWGGLKEVATVAPERIYRVEIITEVGSVRKRTTGVYDVQYARNQSQGKGAWLYYRID